LSFEQSFIFTKLSKTFIKPFLTFPSLQSFIELLKASNLQYVTNQRSLNNDLIHSQVHSVVQTEPTTVTAVPTADRVQTAAQTVVEENSAVPMEQTISSVAQMERTIQHAVLLELQHLQPNLQPQPDLHQS
jgi:hypothetical protein